GWPPPRGSPRVTGTCSPATRSGPCSACGSGRSGGGSTRMKTPPTRTVSSKMLSAVARFEGFTFEETLPGFKWMGHRGQQLKAEGKTILFAYEEAIGFGPGDVVFEKDGLSSAALFAEMLVALRGQDEAKASSSAAAATAATEAEAVTSASPLSLTLRSPSSPPSACTSSSSSCSSSLGFSDGGRTVGPVETPSGSSGSSIVKAAAATVPSTKLSDGGGGGGGGGVEKSKGTPSDIPPPSPSTVRASPPPSPSAVGDCSWDGSANPSSVAPVSAAAPGATPGGTALGDEGSAGEQKSKKSVSSVLLRRVQALHKRYGEFAEENGYVRCEDTEVVSKIFQRLRGSGSYRSSFGGYRVTAVRDLAEGHGFDSETPDGQPSLPVVAGGAHFLTFKFEEEGVVATLRTSGTEPKIKFYLEKQGRPGVPLEEVSAQLSELAVVFLEDALQLKRWGMKRVALA
ncbi:unnamed protein product, partial [Ectocarpus sp. 8 AP-2014]